MGKRRKWSQWRQSRAKRKGKAGEERIKSNLGGASKQELPGNSRARGHVGQASFSMYSTYQTKKPPTVLFPLSTGLVSKVSRQG